MRAAPLLLPLLALLGAAHPGGGSVTVEVGGLRSAKGLVRACLTQVAEAFPDCRKDANALRVSVPAAAARSLTFPAVPPGRYALALLHDENGNGRADTLLMVPREGFGFSRNPGIGLGPPRFARVAFVVADRPVAQAIRLHYLLGKGG